VVLAAPSIELSELAWLIRKMATKTLLEVLEDAEHTLNSNNNNEASEKPSLTHLIDAWRIVQSPEIAALIDLASKECRAAGQPALVGSDESAREEWNRIVDADDPRDLDRLVESFVVPRDGDMTVARAKLLHERSKRCPNPRLWSLFAEHLDPQTFAKNRRRV